MPLSLSLSLSLSPSPSTSTSTSPFAPSPLLPLPLRRRVRRTLESSASAASSYPLDDTCDGALSLLPAWFVSACPPEPVGIVRLPPLIGRVDPDPRWHAAFDEHVPPLVEELIEKRARLLELGAVPAQKSEAATEEIQP